MPTTIVGHAYWKETDAAACNDQETPFMKNPGLIGGLLNVLLEKYAGKLLKQEKGKENT